MSRLSRAIAAILAASACTSATPAPPASPADQPVRGGTLVEAQFSAASSLQPVLSTGGETSRILYLIYARFVMPDATTAEPRPWLATWEQSSDGRTYRWRVAPNAVWSDGAPLIAEDFVTFLREARSSARARVETLGGIDQIEGHADFMAWKTDVPSGVRLDPADPKRMSVTLSAGACTALLRAFTVVPPLPTHVFGKYLDRSAGDAIDRAPENDAPPAASGPFRFAEWRRGDVIRLIRNDLYLRGPPLLDAFEFRTRDRTQVASDLAAGALTYSVLRTTDTAQIAALGADPRARVVRTHAGNYAWIAWNTQSRAVPALQDRRIRQALAYGLDVARARTEILDGEGVLMDAHHAPGHWAHPGGLDPYAYAPQRARELIESAGHRIGASGYYERDGREFALRISTNTENAMRRGLLQFATDQYRAIGVRVVSVVRRFEDVSADLFVGRDADAWILGWSLDPEPDPFREWHSSRTPGPGSQGGNISRFASPQLDAAIERGRDGPDRSLDARKREYATFDRILNAEQPFRFLVSVSDVRAISVRLRGLTPGTWARSCCLDLHAVEKWWLAPEKK